jgi:hypothetical protein
VPGGESKEVTAADVDAYLRALVAHRVIGSVRDQTAGLYKLNSVTHSLQAPGINQPLRAYKAHKVISWFTFLFFKCNLCRYKTAAFAAGFGAVGLCTLNQVDP